MFKCYKNKNLKCTLKKLSNDVHLIFFNINFINSLYRHGFVSDGMLGSRVGVEDEHDFPAGGGDVGHLHHGGHVAGAPVEHKEQHRGRVLGDVFSLYQSLLPVGYLLTKEETLNPLLHTGHYCLRITKILILK